MLLYRQFHVVPTLSKAALKCHTMNNFASNARIGLIWFSHAEHSQRVDSLLAHIGLDLKCACVILGWLNHSILHRIYFMVVTISRSSMLPKMKSRELLDDYVDIQIWFNANWHTLLLTPFTACLQLFRKLRSQRRLLFRNCKALSHMYIDAKRLYVWWNVCVK